MLERRGITLVDRNRPVEPSVEPQVDSVEPVVEPQATTEPIITPEPTHEPTKVTETITLESLTGGRFKELTDIEKIIQENESLNSTPTSVYKTDFAKNIDEYVANGGDPETFIKASKIDIDKLSPIDAAKLYHTLLSDTPLTEDEVNLLIADQYSNYTEEEALELGISESKIKLGQINLKKDADKFKKALAEFKAKATTVEKKEPVQQVYQPTEQEIKAQKELQEAFSKFSGSKITYTQEDTNVDFDVPVYDKDFLSQGVQSPDAIFQKFVDSKGAIQYDKFIEAVNILSDIDKYKQDIAKAYFNKGIEYHLNKINNAGIDNHTTKGDFVAARDGLSIKASILQQIKNQL